MPLRVDIVTAERRVFSDDSVERITVPGVVGELTILPRHAPFMTIIEPGVLRMVKKDEEIEMAISGGFLEVRRDRVSILADSAEHVEEIDLARAEEARRLAREHLEMAEPGVDLAAAEAALRRSLARVRAVERRRRRRGGDGTARP